MVMRERLLYPEEGRWSKIFSLTREFGYCGKEFVSRWLGKARGGWERFCSEECRVLMKTEEAGDGD